MGAVMRPYFDGLKGTRLVLGCQSCGEGAVRAGEPVTFRAICIGGVSRADYGNRRRSAGRSPGESSGCPSGCSGRGRMHSGPWCFTEFTVSETG